MLGLLVRESTTLIVSVPAVASRSTAIPCFDPPRIVRQRDVKGGRVRWLRAGTRDGLARSQIAVGVVGRTGETAYLLRVGPGFRLDVIRTITGRIIGPRAFSR